METSESIVEITKALVATLPEIDNIKPDKQGHNYKYISLEKLLEVAKPILKKHKLAIMQTIVSEPALGPGVTTRILHETGEYLQDTCYAPPTALKGINITQALGATITYLRRYSLMAVLGVTDDDTDGMTPAEITKKNAQTVDQTFNQPTPHPIPQGASSAIGPNNNRDIENVRQLFLNNPVLYEILDEATLVYFRPIIAGHVPYTDPSVADRDIWNLQNTIMEYNNGKTN